MKRVHSAPDSRLTVILEVSLDLDLYIRYEGAQGKAGH